MSLVEQRLRGAMHAGLDGYEPSPDLFARIQGSIEDERARRRWRGRMAARTAGVVAAFVAVGLVLTNRDNGRMTMDWWVLELLTTGLLVVIALFLGPFIKRFGKTYAADVFRANPGTGKSYIVLTDFAYYLIFLAYILFTVSFEASGSWESTVNAKQIKGEVARIGGIVLIIGLLHSLNIVALPVMGRLLSLNRKLDDNDGGGRRPGRRGRAEGAGAALAGGAWVLRIEAASPDAGVEEG